MNDTTASQQQILGHARRANGGEPIEADDRGRITLPAGTRVLTDDIGPGQTYEGEREEILRSATPATVYGISEYGGANVKLHPRAVRARVPEVTVTYDGQPIPAHLGLCGLSVGGRFAYRGDQLVVEDIDGETADERAARIRAKNAAAEAAHAREGREDLIDFVHHDPHA